MTSDTQETDELHQAQRGVQGFTMLELLIVVVILGILAAAVIFGLSGSVVDSAQAACNSDAKNVEIAVEAFHTNPKNVQDPDAYPTSLGQLADPASSGYGGPYLRSMPNSTHYTISLESAHPGHVYVNTFDYDGSPDPCTNVS